MGIIAIIAAVVVGTWNGNWFPSGRAEHRAHPDVEAATMVASAKMLSGGIAAMDPTGTNDIILCLCEIRGPTEATELSNYIGRRDLKVASVSRYRRRDRYDQQQNVIMTTLPVVESGWANWKQGERCKPPRGYAYAAVVIEPAVTAAVYAVHLKANYGATTPEIARDNMLKRGESIRQLLELERRKNRAVIVAGDFNADRWKREFAAEETFPMLEAAGYVNFLSLRPAKERGTHPSRKYGDSALDYIFAKGFDSLAMPRIVPNDELSDHYALYCLLAPSLLHEHSGADRGKRVKPSGVPVRQPKAAMRLGAAD